MGAEVVRRILEAWREGDEEALRELLHSDMELDLTARVLNPATYEGRAGLERWSEEVSEIWAELDMDIERTVEAGDQVLAIVQVRARGRGSGVDIGDRVAQIWTVREGKGRRMRIDPDPENALREFGAG